MSRFPLIIALLLTAVLAIACSGGNSPVQPNVPDLSAQAGNPENHVAWGIFDIQFDLENGKAEIVWDRHAEIHLNVTNAVLPPKCSYCVKVVDSQYNPGSLKFNLVVAFTNPTPITGYDVRAVIANPGGQKYLLNPDGMTTVWGSPMQYKAINIDPERSFGPYESHGRMFEFYFPPSENFKTMTYIVDASWPGNVDEPLVENGYSEPVVNNGYGTTFVRAKIFDHQGNLNPATIMADLVILGGSPQTKMYDDGAHNDLAAGDGVYGTSAFGTTVPFAVYMVNVYAIDLGGNMGWGQVPVYVQKTSSGPNDDPIINGVTTDKTTANGAKNEKIKITVNAYDPNGDTLGYQFQAASGTFSGQNENYIFWKPGNTYGPVTINITVVDDQGGSAQTSKKCWSTNLPDKGDMPTGTLPSIKPTKTLNMPGDFAGQVVYINIWATWCGYCIVEMPDLTAVYNKYKSKEGYNQIFLNLQESEATALAFINSNPYACTYWALDSSGGYFAQLKSFNGGSGGIPQHFLFDRDGNCRYSKVGAYMSGTAELEAAIDQLL